MNKAKAEQPGDCTTSAKQTLSYAGSILESPAAKESRHNNIWRFGVRRLQRASKLLLAAQRVCERTPGRNRRWSPSLREGGTCCVRTNPDLPYRLHPGSPRCDHV